LIAQTGVTHSVQGATSFGQITANANTLPIVLPALNATLNGLVSTSDAIVTKSVQGSSSLGSLSATIDALPEVEVTGESLLGALTATAESTTPTPPPTPQYGSRYGYRQVQNKKKPKTEPIVVEPVFINFDIEPLEPLVKTVFGNAIFNAGIFGAQAQSQIDFSSEQDEADLLLIL
jgi:hypothetical protein